MQHQNALSALDRPPDFGTSVANNNAMASAAVKARAQKDRLGMAVCPRRIALLFRD